VMLSGETAMGAFPVKAVEMMVKIALDVEGKIKFKTYPPDTRSDIEALSRAITGVAEETDPACIVVMTTSGRSAAVVAAERPNVPVFAFTTHPKVYHALNLLWGLSPQLIADHPDTFEEMVAVAEKNLLERNLAARGDKILLLGGIPAHASGGTNFIKVHTIGH